MNKLIYPLASPGLPLAFLSGHLMDELVIKSLHNKDSTNSFRK
jgi:hypothetical protein